MSGHALILDQADNDTAIATCRCGWVGEPGKSLKRSLQDAVDNCDTHLREMFPKNFPTLFEEAT